jgi:hypothetical protein
MSVVNGIVFLSQFGEERAQSGWGCGWVIEFIAEVEVELHPFMVSGRRVSGNWAWSSRRSKQLSLRAIRSLIESKVDYSD